MQVNRIPLRRDLRQLTAQIEPQQTPEKYPLRRAAASSFPPKTRTASSAWIPSRVQVSTVVRTGFHTRFVARHARQIPAPGPAPVAVHDDRDVSGQAAGINRVSEDPVLTAGLEKPEKFFHRAKHAMVHRIGARSLQREPLQRDRLGLLLYSNGCAGLASVQPPIEIVTGMSPFGVVAGMRTLN